jgi:hypothetical protein
MADRAFMLTSKMSKIAALLAAPFFPLRIPLSARIVDGHSRGGLTDK